MNTNRQKVVIYSIVLGFTLLSFAVSYTTVLNQTNTNQTVRDKYSDTTYNTGAASNYKDFNPYGSQLIGFSELSDRGVSNDEYAYIVDTILNFTMYTEHVYNGKISLVKDSFTRDITDNNNKTLFSFKFSINDQAPLAAKIESDSIEKVFLITITDLNSSTKFTKKLNLNSPDEKS